MCKHFFARLEITITRRIDAKQRFDETQPSVQHDAPNAIRIVVVCPDCKHLAVYNAHAQPGDGRASADRWPTWLLNLLIPLRAVSPVVHEACLVCDVPPKTHVTWGA